MFVRGDTILKLRLTIFNREVGHARVGHPQPVLDGKIDEFLEAYLRWKLGKS